MSTTLIHRLCSASNAFPGVMTARRAILAATVMALSTGASPLALAQQNVFSRSDAGTNLWENNSNRPWFYQTWDSNEARPDLWPQPTRNDVFFGHNNNLTQDINTGTWYALRSLTMQGSASSGRTFNSSGGAGISLSVGYTGQSGTGAHTFNNQFGIDGSTVTFTNNGGLFTATNTIFVNSNTIAFAGSSNFAISGGMQGTGGSLTKSGAGTLTLSGTNTYTGATTVSGGTLRVNGSTTSNTTVASTATLAGTGTLSGTVNVNSGAFVAPGTTTGTLTTGSFTLGGTYTADINWNGNYGAAPSADLIDVSGSVTLQSSSTLAVQMAGAGGTFSGPRYIVLIRNDASEAVSGIFGSVTGLSGFTYSLLYNFDAATSTEGVGNDVALKITAVPEPTTMGVLLMASGLLLRRRR